MAEPVAPKAPPKAGGNPLTKGYGKSGKVKGWMILGGVALVVGGYLYLKNKNASTSTNPADVSGGGAASGGGGGSLPLALAPAFTPAGSSDPSNGSTSGGTSARQDTGNTASRVSAIAKRLSQALSGENISSRPTYTVPLPPSSNGQPYRFFDPVRTYLPAAGQRTKSGGFFQ